MDKKIKKERKIINPIFTFILGIVLTAGTVYALSISARDVSFIGSSDIDANNVQSAIENVYASVVKTDEMEKKLACVGAYSRSFGVNDSQTTGFQFNYYRNYEMVDAVLNVYNIDDSHLSYSNDSFMSQVSLEHSVSESGNILNIHIPQKSPITITNVDIWPINTNNDVRIVADLKIEYIPSNSFRLSLRNIRVTENQILLSSSTPDAYNGVPYADVHGIFNQLTPNGFTVKYSYISKLGIDGCEYTIR